MSSSMQVYSGIAFDPLHPDPAKIKITDIAHALSRQCRYGGHTGPHYSVAEHSVRVSRQLPPELKFEGLMHDASEYALQDVCSPLKAEPEFGRIYREYEDMLMRMISRKYGFNWPVHPLVKKMDNVLLATEQRDLLPPMLDLDEKHALWDPWLQNSPLVEKIVPWTAEFAEKIFLTEFDNHRPR